MNVVPLARLVAERRLLPTCDSTVRGVLAEANLLVADGSGVDGSRLREVRDTLDRCLAPACTDERCRAIAPDFARGDMVVDVAPPQCPVCRGSDNARAIARLQIACRDSGVRRVLVVGGSPNGRDAIIGRDYISWDHERAIGTALGIEIRTVDGTAHHTLSEARANITWADLVVVWAPTQLAHKVSTHYTGQWRHARTITCSRRGVTALCDEIVLHLRNGGGRATRRRPGETPPGIATRS